MSQISGRGVTSPPRSIQTNLTNATKGLSPTGRVISPPRSVENCGKERRSDHSLSKNTHGARATMESAQSSENSHKGSEKSKTESWKEAGYVPISPVSEEAMEIQLVLPSERTAAPMDKTPARKVTQTIPMFDDPISSASEDENRVDGAAPKSEVVRVPRQNSMRLPETATPVITISRTANTWTASTSRAGLLVQAQTVDGSRS